MTHFLVTMQMTYRQMFLVEADTEEQARLTYGDGEQSDYSHGEREIINVEQVELKKAHQQLDLFGEPD